MRKRKDLYPGEVFKYHGEGSEFLFVDIPGSYHRYEEEGERVFQKSTAKISDSSWSDWQAPVTVYGYIWDYIPKLKHLTEPSWGEYSL